MHYPERHERKTYRRMIGIEKAKAYGMSVIPHLCIEEL